jgi:hypothetical protein
MRRTKKPASVARRGNISKYKWKKGDISPNPSGLPGRPKLLEIGTMIDAIFAEVHPRTGKTNLQTLLEMWYRRAKQGDTNKGRILLAYKFGLPIAQALNINANLDESEMTAEQVHQKLTEYHDKLGIPKPVWSPGGLSLDRDGIRRRIEELLAKREERKAARKPPPQLTQGSESIQ